MSQKKLFSLHEAAVSCGLGEEVIIKFIRNEWVVPFGPFGSFEPSGKFGHAESRDPVLDEEDLARARLIWELQERLGVNDESIPIVLHLIDQLNKLHLQLIQSGYCQTDDF